MIGPCNLRGRLSTTPYIPWLLIQIVLLGVVLETVYEMMSEHKILQNKKRMESMILARRTEEAKAKQMFKPESSGLASPAAVEEAMVAPPSSSLSRAAVQEMLQKQEDRLQLMLRKRNLLQQLLHLEKVSGFVASPTPPPVLLPRLTVPNQLHLVAPPSLTSSTFSTPLELYRFSPLMPIGMTRPVVALNPSPSPRLDYATSSSSSSPYLEAGAGTASHTPKDKKTAEQAYFDSYFVKNRGLKDVLHAIGSTKLSRLPDLLQIKIQNIDVTTLPGFEQHIRPCQSLGSTSGKSVREGGTFPFKLHDMLLDVKRYSSGGETVIAFAPDGRSFIIQDTRRFVNDILPHFFSQKHFTSFTRQLHLWGFVRGSPDYSASSPVLGEAASFVVFSHPLFLREYPELCGYMRRVGAGEATPKSSFSTTAAKKY